MKSLLKHLLVVILVVSCAFPQNRAFKSLEQPSNEKRIALVVGNGTYKISPLRNPPNDARAMAKTLQSLGFTVTSKINAPKKELRRAIDDFGRSIRNGGVGLFYYAGHGVQFEGKNYLIPVDAEIISELDVEDEAVSIDRVLARMDDAKNRMNIVILDACRNNPFASSFRSVARGLAQMKAPAGTFVAYATAPGSIAEDGDGVNGLYTQELLKEIVIPNEPLESVFKKVLSSVKERTSARQVPWTASSVEGEFYFVESISKPNQPKTITTFTTDSSKREAKITADRFNLGDLDKQIEAKKLEEQHLAADRAQKLAEMKDAFQKVMIVLKDKNVSREKKNFAKERFLEYFNMDFPWTTDDDEMRASLQDSPVNMEFVLVKGGRFQMGSIDGSDENPVHTVTLSDFYIGQYEVTQKQWQEVMGNNPSNTKGDDLPVENVSWTDAQQFITKMNKMTKMKFRLPTEAEWEYAARGGNESKGFVYAGANSLDSIAWYRDNAGKQTHPIGTKQPNELEIYDMSGNVWEWCNDWYDEDFYTKSPERNPLGATSGSLRVMRGGSYNSDQAVCRPGSRNKNNPDVRGSTGIRLVKTQ